MTHLEAAYTDERGEITHILEREDLRHVSLITCKKNSVRGQHFHKLDHQYLFVLSGTFRYTTKDVNQGEWRVEILKPGSLAYTPPYIAHKLRALSNGMVLQLSTAPRIELEHKDTFAYEL